MMLMCGGDVVQYSALKKISIVDYLIKLDIFVSEQEQIIEQNEQAKNAKIN